MGPIQTAGALYFHDFPYPVNRVEWGGVAFWKKKNLSVFKREFDRMLKQMQARGEMARLPNQNDGIAGEK
jgi:hypothetical protein